jgi:hypothetical protein
MTTLKLNLVVLRYLVTTLLLLSPTLAEKWLVVRDDSIEDSPYFILDDEYSNEDVDEIYKNDPERKKPLSCVRDVCYFIKSFFKFKGLDSLDLIMAKTDLFNFNGARYFADSNGNGVIQFEYKNGESITKLENQVRGLREVGSMEEAELFFPKFQGVLNNKDFYAEPLREMSEIYRVYFGGGDDVEIKHLYMTNVKKISLDDHFYEPDPFAMISSSLQMALTLNKVLSRINEKFYMVNLNIKTVCAKGIKPFELAQMRQSGNSFFIRDEPAIIRINNFSDLQLPSDSTYNPEINAVLPGQVPPEGPGANKWEKWDSYSYALLLLDVELKMIFGFRISDILAHAWNPEVVLNEKEQNFRELCKHNLAENIKEIVKDDALAAEIDNGGNRMLSGMSPEQKHVFFLAGVLAYFRMPANLEILQASVIKLGNSLKSENLTQQEKLMNFARMKLVDHSIPFRLMYVNFLVYILMLNVKNRPKLPTLNKMFTSLLYNFTKVAGVELEYYEKIKGEEKPTKQETPEIVFLTTPMDYSKVPLGIENLDKTIIGSKRRIII